MIALTCALITGAILSLLIPSTRSIGIGCVTILTFLFPIPMTILVVIGMGLFLYSKKIF